jgi:dihydropteroate synthase
LSESAPVPIELEALAPSQAHDAWLRPLGLLRGSFGARAVAAGSGLPLAGGNAAFTLVELLARRRDGAIETALAPLPRLRVWAEAGGPPLAAHVAARLEALGAKRPAWAGFALDQPIVMGIVNVTPDSFSDGGAFADPARAIAHGRALLDAGADIIDIGGESTRPGAEPVSPEEQIRRIAPVIEPLAKAGAAISVDTRHAAVMAMALERGARIVNDVTALAGDAASLGVVARAGAPVVLMHMQGEPRTMQAAPRYALASLDVLEALAQRIAACEAAGVPRANIVVDPGIGFGKAPQHNLEILARLALFHALGTGVMIGISRKSLVGRIAPAPVGERLPGSLAGALHALDAGVQILRVHDVAETRQAVALWRAIAEGA